MANVMKSAPNQVSLTSVSALQWDNERGSQIHTLFIKVWFPRVRLPSSLESGCSLASSPLVANIHTLCCP